MGKTRGTGFSIGKIDLADQKVILAGGKIALTLALCLMYVYKCIL